MMFKVINTQTGKDVTGEKDWLLDPKGKLHYYLSEPYENWLYEADECHQVSTPNESKKPQGGGHPDGDYSYLCGSEYCRCTQ